jgi:hypothetical protein
VFTTYENRTNPHVTIHASDCGQLRKHGGEHKHNQGAYREHATFSAAKTYADRASLKIVLCSFCKPETGSRP